MRQIRKKHKFSLPITTTVCITPAIILYLSLSHFLGGYRRGTYDRIINSNISMLKETTSTLISKTTEGFNHCRYEIRVLGIDVSEELRENGSDSIDNLSNGDCDYLRDFNKVFIFDYCVLLNEPGRGVYSQEDNVKPTNLYSSQVCVGYLNSPDREAVSFISDSFSASGRDVVAFSCRTGSVILIGIYNQESSRALYDFTALGDNTSYMITTGLGLIFSRTRVNQGLGGTLNLFAYFEEDPLDVKFFRPDAQGGTEYERVLSDFRDDRDGSTEIYSGDSRYELVYTPIPRTDQGFISCVSYDHITADAAWTNQETTQLTMLTIMLMLGMFLVIVIMLTFVVRANASREAVRRDRTFTPMTRYVPNAIVVVDSESGTIEYASRNTGQVLGIEDVSGSAIGDKFLSCISGSDRQAILDSISRIRKGDCANGNLKLYFTRPDVQKDVVLLPNAYLISEQDSSQRSITVTLGDITEWEQSRRRLEKALENETRANTARSTFLASVSHNIRIPLNAVIGLTNLALYPPRDNKKVTECLQKTVNSSQLLLGLINDVLDMSKVGSGRMQLAETKFELGEWLPSVVTMAQSQTSVRSQHFDVNIWNITHKLLYSDTIRLGQVLTNVLGNAVKFTPKGGEICLDITEVPSQDPSFANFAFRASDAGVDMNREYMGRTFKMFSRDQSFCKQGIQGTSLGMAITEHIVDLIDGIIRMESEPEKGTTFTTGLSIRLSSRHMPLAAGRAMLVTDEPGSEEKCRDIVEKLEEIGMDVAWEADYQATVSLVAQKRVANRPLFVAFLLYKMPRLDRTLTREQPKRDLSGDTLWLLGLKPDKQELFERIRQRGFKYTISLSLFWMSLYQKIIRMLGQGESTSGGLVGELKSMRSLVIEGNAVNLEIAVKILSGLMGAAVDTARNGEEGCICFLGTPEDTYDVILMGLQTLVPGGLDTARRIRESIHPRAAPVPIIALTASTSEGDRRETLEARMSGFVPKPIDFTVLTKEVDRVRREGRCLRFSLAEDNEPNRKIAAELIQADGQQVDAVEDRHQALETYLNASDGIYDVILPDLRVPVMDDSKAAVAIRSGQRKSAGSILVFAFTPSSEDEVRSEATRAGFSAILTKLVNMEQLRGLLG